MPEKRQPEATPAAPPRIAPVAGSPWVSALPAAPVAAPIPALAGFAAVEPGWCAFRVAGTLDFALTGVLAGLAGALARTGISLFAISTWDTDYILVKRADADAAVAAWRAGGHEVSA